MFLKRTSPNLVLALAGLTPELGDINSHNNEVSVLELNPLRQAKTKIKPLGRCNHFKKSPVFYAPPLHHKKHPNIINESIDALKATYKAAKRLAKLFYRNRKIASQRREAIISVLCLMLQYCDMETLQVGFYNDTGDFVRLDIGWIARQTNLSMVRVSRVISDLKKAGYLTSIRQYRINDEGQKRGTPSIRTLSKSLFLDLKIDSFKLWTAQEYKRKQNEKKLAKKAKSRLQKLISAFSINSSKASTKHYTAIRKASTLLEHVTKEVMTVIKTIDRHSE